MNKKQLLTILGFVAAVVASAIGIVEQWPDSAPALAPAQSAPDAGR